MLIWPRPSTTATWPAASEIFHFCGMKLSQKHWHLLLYGLLLALLVLVLKWLQWKYLLADHSMELYIGLVALLFTGLGAWVAVQLVPSKPKTVVVEKKVEEVPIEETPLINQIELARLNLTPREYEVLQLLAKGYSNAEIAEALYLSLSTIKTHVSGILFKMEVPSRTKALEKAKRLKIIA